MSAPTSELRSDATAARAPVRTSWRSHAEPWFQHGARLSLLSVQLVTALTAAGFIGTYLWVAFARLSFPFDIEWMEGAMLDHVRQISKHGHVYLPPSVDFTPYIYNPVFYYATALVSVVTGLDYSTARGVSVAASIANLALLFVLVRRETGSRLSGAFAAGLFAATFPLSGFWFDLARVDSLALTFTLLAVFYVRIAERPRHLVLAGAAAFLAFGTKQSALILIPTLAAYLLLFEGWRKAAWFTLPAALLTGLLVLTLNLASDGWYLRYALLTPSGHSAEYDVRTWEAEVGAKLSLGIAFALFYLLSAGIPLKKKALYGGAAAACVILAYFSRAHSMSYVNVNIPAHALLALLAGLGSRAFLGASARHAQLLACGVVIAQFWLLRYDPAPQIPTAAERRAVHEFRALIRGFPGRVLVAHHGFVGWREGKGDSIHEMARYDVDRSSGFPEAAKASLRRQFAEALATRKYSALVLDYDIADALPGLDRYYRRIPLVLGASRPAQLEARVGLRVRPSLVYVPR